MSGMGDVMETSDSLYSVNGKKFKRKKQGDRSETRNRIRICKIPVNFPLNYLLYNFKMVLYYEMLFIF
jgi:hypothetical protein